MKICIIAGEASGDLHAGGLFRELKKIDSSLTAFGTGGDAMTAEGFSAFYDVRDMAVTGFTEVFSHFRFLRKIFNEMLDRVSEERPDALILVDYPDFNIRFGKKARVRFPDMPIVYFISPQVWAWRKGRVKTIGKFATQVIVIFPFEEEIYKKAGVSVYYAGHPLADSGKTTIEREPFLKNLNLDPRKKTVGIFPGSRKNEVSRHLKKMLLSAEVISEKIPNTQFIVSSAPTIPENFIENSAEWRRIKDKIPVVISRDKIYNLLNSADAAITSAGTATVEAAIMNVPMVVVYDFSALSFLIARLLVKVPHIAMVNLIAGERLVTELVHREFQPAAVAREISALLEDDAKREKMKNGLKKVKESLGAPGAAERAARAIFSLLEKKTK